MLIIKIRTAAANKKSDMDLINPRGLTASWVFRVLISDIEVSAKIHLFEQAFSSGNILHHQRMKLQYKQL